MLGSAPVPSRALLEALHPLRRTSLCECSKLIPPIQSTSRVRRRNVSTASPQRQEMEVDKDARSRWSRTPPAMKAPIRSKPKPILPGHSTFKVDGDPKSLDEMYTKFLGRTGPDMLSHETKWLAITHKSFDQGRRGFNDRLSFLGKKIVELQTCIVMLSATDSKGLNHDFKDTHGRMPFQHPAIESAEVLTTSALSWFAHPKQLSRLAEQYNIPHVVRWLPRNPAALQASGCDMVYAQALYAIIGALALEQGGAVANKIAKERIIQPMHRRGGNKKNFKTPTNPSKANESSQFLE